MRYIETPPNTTSTGEQRPAFQLLKTRDVLAALNINRELLQSLIESGRLPVIRLGKDFRFSPDAVRQLVADSTVGGGR